MKKFPFLGFFLVFTLLTGCGTKQVHKNWYALDGSRADATVKVALSWNPEKEVPLSDQAQADKIAEERCKAWGYSGAEMFGAVTQKCTQMGYTGFRGCPACFLILKGVVISSHETNRFS